jgi:hypothetical protein
VPVLDEDTAGVSVAKVASTPEDPMRAVLDGLAAANVDLAQTTLLSHGTTVATNALLTRRFPPAAMVTTKGFRDVIEIRRGTRDDLWDAHKDVALADGGYTGDLLLLHSGGGVMTPALVDRYAVRLARASRPARSPRATWRCCAGTATRSGSTWAVRAPTSRSCTTASCA